MTIPVLVATNATGTVQNAEMDNSPYLIDADGRPYVPIGDGGVVLGLNLGDSVFGYDTDHASPAVSIIHPDQGARYALTAFACLGNKATVRSGAASGARGTVLGKRGEQGRVLVWFAPEVLEKLVPGDSVVVRTFGQGARLPDALADLGGQLLNVDPELLARLPIAIGDKSIAVTVRGKVGSKLVGNGIGRPAHQWDLDLQVNAETAGSHGLEYLALGDLVCVQNLDVRHNAGHRHGWVTIGLIVTTTSPRPGHGAGLMPILCIPENALALDIQRVRHIGVTAATLASRSTEDTMQPCAEGDNTHESAHDEPPLPGALERGR